MNKAAPLENKCDLSESDNCTTTCKGIYLTSREWPSPSNKFRNFALSGLPRFNDLFNFTVWRKRDTQQTTGSPSFADQRFNLVIKLFAGS